MKPGGRRMQSVQMSSSLPRGMFGLKKVLW
jgi:hypothetical protein